MLSPWRFAIPGVILSWSSGSCTDSVEGYSGSSTNICLYIWRMLWTKPQLAFYSHDRVFTSCRPSFSSDSKLLCSPRNYPSSFPDLINANTHQFFDDSASLGVSKLCMASSFISCLLPHFLPQITEGLAISPHPIPVGDVLWAKGRDFRRGLGVRSPLHHDRLLVLVWHSLDRVLFKPLPIGNVEFSYPGIL